MTNPSLLAIISGVLLGSGIARISAAEPAWIFGIFAGIVLAMIATFAKGGEGR